LQYNAIAVGNACATLGVDGSAELHGVTLAAADELTVTEVHALSGFPLLPVSPGWPTGR
jgi:hypothetical protein